MTNDLIAQWVERYGFRARRAEESEAAYREAVIKHVSPRDLSAAHELRVGRPQAEWTDADIDGFLTTCDRNRSTRSELPPGLHLYHVVEDPGPVPPTNEQLLRMAAIALDVTMEHRCKEPERELAVMASVLLMSGSILHASVNSWERIAFLRAAAQSHPVFGFLLVFDGWIHMVEERGAKRQATKKESLFAQIGSRDFRRTLLRSYRYLENRTRVVFDNPPPEDITQETLREGHDPYADIFVTVPSPERVQ